MPAVRLALTLTLSLAALAALALPGLGQDKKAAKAPPPRPAGEKPATLEGFLEWQRHWKTRRTQAAGNSIVVRQLQADEEKEYKEQYEGRKLTGASAPPSPRPSWSTRRERPSSGSRRAVSVGRLPRTKN